MTRRRRLAPLALVLALPLAAAAEPSSAQPRPEPEGPRSKIGHLVPAGCPDHDPPAEAAACSAHAGAAGVDTWLLAGANRELFLLHRVPPELAAAIRAQAGRPVEVTGEFRWQGRLRTLRPEAVRAVTEEELDAARAAEPEYVMKGYYMTILRPGPKQKSFTEEERKALMEGHFGHIRKQAAAGTLLLAGPFGEQQPERTFSGIYLYEVESLERATALTGEDPAFQAGYFEATTIPWFGPASLSF